MDVLRDAARTATMFVNNVTAKAYDKHWSEQATSPWTEFSKRRIDPLTNWDTCWFDTLPDELTKAHWEYKIKNLVINHHAHSHAARFNIIHTVYLSIHCLSVYSLFICLFT